MHDDIIFANAPVGILYTADGYVLRANPALARQFGHGVAELEGRRVADMPFVDAAALTEPLAAQLAQSVVAYDAGRLDEQTADFEFGQAPALLREMAAGLDIQLD